MTQIRADQPRKRSFLARLRADTAGNTIALMAAGLVPTIGVIGSGVDLGRMYLARTRLQAACDSGALMGRKLMATGAWDANNNAANAGAIKSFDANFVAGSYGTTGVTRSFAESGGVVTGTVTATLPLTMMKFFGSENDGMTLSCTAEMRIPNTDVMFVLDTTGSMTGKAVSTDSQSKIAGLKDAVKCFYEALAKENIDDITAATCGETTSPAGGNSAGVQLRFGFVPYSVNANVGKLLPTAAFADNWTYQSRRSLGVSGGTTTQVNTPTIGTYGSTTTVGSPVVGSTVTSNWVEIGEDITVAGEEYSEKFSVSNGSQATCDTYNAISGNVPAPQTSTRNDGSSYSTPATPVHPQSSVSRTGTTVVSQVVTTYAYRFRNNKCRISYQTATTPTTTNVSQTASVTWATTTQTTNSVFQGWSYEPVTFNVSGLKSGMNWNNSLNMPLGSQGAQTSVNWNGCIEEAATVRADSDPSNDWSPIPAAANDMKINLIPNPADTSTLFGPLMSDAVYERTSLYQNNGSWQPSNTRTLDTIEYSGDMSQPAEACPSEARLHQSWTSSTFKTYVNGITTGGNTYHDIGLIWGGRFASPHGMFSSLTAPPNKNIERHMIFMTDGDTNASATNYNAYGMQWYDRRQTDVSSAPSDTLLEANIDARTAALCTAIKNENITLWVVSYGSGVSTATDTRLTACASPGKFFKATSTSALVTNFKAMAAEISALRLTQ